MNKSSIAEEKEYNDKFYFNKKESIEFIEVPTKVRNKMKHLTPKKKKRK